MPPPTRLSERDAFLAAAGLDPLQLDLLERHRIEVPISCWPAPPDRFVRISTPIYTTLADFERLGTALRAELPIA